MVEAGQGDQVDAGHLFGPEDELGGGRAPHHHRRHPVAGPREVVVEAADDVALVAAQPDLLVHLAQRAGEGAFVGVEAATGKSHLTGMGPQTAGAAGDEQAGLAVRARHDAQGHRRPGAPIVAFGGQRFEAGQVRLADGPEIVVEPVHHVRRRLGGGP